MINLDFALCHYFIKFSSEQYTFSNQSSKRLALAYSKVSVDRFKDKC